jgi:hypothetical protein
MFRKTIIALLALASFGVLSLDIASARGGFGGGGGFHGGGGFGGGGFHGGGMGGFHGAASMAADTLSMEGASMVSITTVSDRDFG